MLSKKIALILLGVGALAAAGYLIAAKKANNPLDSGQEGGILEFAAKTQESGGVSFEATPLLINFENPVQFKIEIDTHSGSLDFDLVKIAILQDGRGNEYRALDWQGSAPGDHHMSGIITFPRVNPQPEIIKLIINNLQSSMVFEWEIKAKD